MGDARLIIFGVSCADLIRASISLHEMHFSKRMDCRVKPGNDDNQSHHDNLRAQQ
jgi:hypothetical protein